MTIGTTSRLALYGLAVTAIGLSLAASLRANSIAGRMAAPTAVATVDWLAATEDLLEWEKVREDLDQKKADLQDEVEKRAEEQESRKQQLEMLGEGTVVYEQTLNEVRLLAVQNQAWLEFMEQKIQREELAAQINIYNKICEAVEAVAQRDGWDIVLWDDSESKRPDAANLQKSMEQVSRRYVLFTNASTVDITDDIVRYMNVNSKSGATGANP